MTSVLEMALADLEDAQADINMRGDYAKTIAALKEAIKNQGEPVAWLSPNGLQASTSRMLNGTPLCHCTSVPAGEPVARVVIKTGDISFYLAEWLREPNDGDLLYTSAPTIPEGWQLVPVAPTPKMIHEGQMSRLCQVTGSESAAAIYKAMLSAAPKGDKP